MLLAKIHLFDFDYSFRPKVYEIILTLLLLGAKTGLLFVHLTKQIYVLFVYVIEQDQH